MIFLPIWTDYIFLIAALFNRNRRVKTPDSVDTMITSFQAIIPLRIDSIQCENRASLVAQMVKRLPAMRETRVQSLGWEDPLEKEMATHSSILAWKISWMEPGRLQSSGSRRFGQVSNFTSLQCDNRASQVALVGKNPPANARSCRRHGFDPWIRKISCRRTWKPTPVFLPGEPHGQESLVGYSPSIASQRVRHD